jgi:hypothetical protein
MSDLPSQFKCKTVPDWANPGFFGDFSSSCYDSEKKMLDGLIAENENIFGIQCAYYRMSLDTKKDEFLGDDPTKHAIDSFRFMAVAPEAATGKFVLNAPTIFGFDSDAFDIEAGIAHFLASDRKNGMPPMVGDVVQIIGSKIFYSIIYVDDMKAKTQPMGKKTIYNIKLKIWENNHHGAEFGDELSDDPMGDLAEYQKAVDKKNEFDVKDQLDKLRSEDETFYKPGDVELPPNNDKDNPFPAWW